MGRYYSGDINGKFWFAAQSSTDASFFGGIESNPSIVQYHFSTDDLDDIKQGIATCKMELGEYKDKLDAFFKEHNSYNDEMLVESLKVDKDKVNELLTWYARLHLGEQILACVEKQETCDFDAEL